MHIKRHDLQMESWIFHLLKIRVLVYNLATKDLYETQLYFLEKYRHRTLMYSMLNYRALHFIFNQNCNIFHRIVCRAYA